jgi:hypothetical protein
MTIDTAHSLTLARGLGHFWATRIFEFESGRRDLNSGPLVPQTSALTRLRHAP